MGLSRRDLLTGGGGVAAGAALTVAGYELFGSDPAPQPVPVDPASLRPDQLIVPGPLAGLRDEGLRIAATVPDFGLEADHAEVVRTVRAQAAALGNTVVGGLTDRYADARTAQAVQWAANPFKGSTSETFRRERIAIIVPAIGSIAAGDIASATRRRFDFALARSVDRRSIGSQMTSGQAEVLIPQITDEEIRRLAEKAWDGDNQASSDLSKGASDASDTISTLSNDTYWELYQGSGAHATYLQGQLTAFRAATE